MHNRVINEKTITILVVAETERKQMGLHKEDLSEYNSADSPWYRIVEDGNVNIGIEQGSMQIAGLSADGMFKLVNEWLSSNASLSGEKKQQLIDKLK